MMLIRGFERRAQELSTSASPLIAGSVHLCAGQEAVPVGAMAALRKGDKSVATYRGHGWAIEADLDLDAIFAELCHRATGVNGGRAGSAMIAAPWSGFIGENSIVGAGGPIACGAALASLVAGDGGVAIVSFGDGATNQGALHEAFAFAAAKNLPVIFVCENNGWSELTPTSAMVRIPRLAQRAAGYPMPGATIDGTDPIAVRDTIALAAARARVGEGPSFVEARVPRLWGHYNRDLEHYRPKDDREAAAARDPIPALTERLIASGHADRATIDRIAAETEARLDAMVESARAAPFPDPALARAHVTVRSAASAPAPVAADKPEATYIQSVNEALRRALAEDPAVLVYGEDVGQSGGIFQAARYLQRDFGEGRVFDTPISEAAILGSAVGAALCGMKPVVEIMWGDFMLVALDQMINQAANYRYVTQGRANVPMVMRTQHGSTPGSCPQHAQCLEALLAHIPGLKVGLPATPADAYAMLRAAIADPDPVVLFESRALYQTKAPVDFDAPVEPVAGARLRRQGKHLVLITWSTRLAACLEAAETLAREGIEASVLDLRWLSPLDDTAIERALDAAGGRALVVHEANLTGGFGAEIVARMTERRPDARLRRLALPDTRVPASPVLQAALMPTPDRIVQAARALARA
ncbi:MAG: thiamine pyrophosphate-dependent enzyme [Tagaea sp.]|nr:thiamine pyrophosphate-dependent enzyme [Tagaea sp.]